MKRAQVLLQQERPGDGNHRCCLPDVTQRPLTCSFSSKIFNLQAILEDQEGQPRFSNLISIATRVPTSLPSESFLPQTDLLAGSKETKLSCFDF